MPFRRAAPASTELWGNWEKHVPKLFVHLLQDHKYVVSAEVLYKSWLLDGAELTFIQKLSESRRNETRGS